MSKNRKGKCIGAEHPFSKKILCLENNKIFGSIREAERCMNLDSSSIAKVCKGIYKSTKGYHFKYI